MKVTKQDLLDLMQADGYLVYSFGHVGIPHAVVTILYEDAQALHEWEYHRSEFLPDGVTQLEILTTCGNTLNDHLDHLVRHQATFAIESRLTHSFFKELYTDLEPEQPGKCVCDFVSVILPRGCQCGGQ